MFLTGLNTDSLIRREPALADFDPSYATNFPDRINEAKAVIDNRLRASGYDLDKIGLKDYFWHDDNDGGPAISKTITGINSGQTLLVLQTSSVITDILVRNSEGTKTFLVKSVNNTDFVTLGFILQNFDGTSVKLDVYSPGEEIAGNSIQAYLTDPAVYFVHLYKALHLIYESFISEPGDLFERKAETYRMAYENEFNTMVTYYDRNGDGTTDENDGMRPMKQVRFMR